MRAKIWQVASGKWQEICRLLWFVKRKANNAFTLVELSIVLVIIGFLAGGVLVGKELIAAAEIRALVNDYTQYQSAYNTFKLKYNCIVADCRDALQLFGSNHGNQVAGAGNSAIGNGDGIISLNYETRYACWQLGITNLVKSACTVGGFPTGAGINAGINALPSSYKTDREVEIGYPQFLASGNYIDPSYAGYGNFIYIAQNTGIASGDVYPVALFSGGILPSEAKSLDEKIDDGKPFSGKLVQFNWSSECGIFVTNSYITSGVYYNQTHCPSYYRLDN